MKYVVLFLVMCVAFAAAAPQYFNTWPGYYGAGYIGGAPGTLVAGPTVVNTPAFGYDSRFIAPGYVGPAII